MKIKITIIAIAAVLLGGILFNVTREEKIKIEKTSADGLSSGTGEIPCETPGSLTETSEEDGEGTIFAFACGEVSEPGVYEVKAGSRINDLIVAAGGFTEDACRDYVNLAEPLYDGEKVRIPSLKEVEEGLPLSDESSGIVNINTAGIDELMTLPGIGESKAGAIIKYRNEHGRYSCGEDLMNVGGIGESTYETLKDLITV